MFELHRLGKHSFGDRELFTAKASGLDELPSSISLSSRHFVCLMALDAEILSTNSIATLAHKLLQSGCVYFSCWGPDSSRVHDLIDLADIDMHPEGPWAMTTWHEDESLSEALWHVLNVSWPDSAFEHDCTSTLAISMGNADWATEIHSAFNDPSSFTTRILNSNGGAA